jgi:hypothetical protein|tara:strand:- start:198 stop:575 length:378 start_codon:yes stop_codon:yes gene_type:complete
MKIKIFFILLLFSSNILAVSAAPGDLLFNQSNGQSFNGQLRGDKWFNWIEDNRGRVIQYNSASSNYEYIILSDRNGALSLSFSGISAANNAPLRANHSGLYEFGIVDRVKLSVIASQIRDSIVNR